MQAQDSLLMEQDDEQQRAMDAYKKSMGRNLPKVKTKKKTVKKPKASPSMEERPDWNGRFFVESMGNFTKIHRNYKVRCQLITCAAIF